MKFSDFMLRHTIEVDVQAGSKKALLQHLARRSAEALELDPKAVLDAVIERERLGPTGVGGGVAIPHARLEGLTHMAGTFARVVTPIDFDAADGEDADLIFLLLAPEDAGVEHLKALALVAREMRQPNVRARLRSASTPEAVLAVLEGEPAEA